MTDSKNIRGLCYKSFQAVIDSTLRKASAVALSVTSTQM